MSQIPKVVQIIQYQATQLVVLMDDGTMWRRNIEGGDLQNDLNRWFKINSPSGKNARSTT